MKAVLKNIKKNFPHFQKNEFFLINFDNFMPLFHYLKEINKVPGNFNKFKKMSLAIYEV